MGLNKLLREAPLIVAALFIGFVIWLIAMQGNRETSWVTVPIRIENVPDNMTAEIVSPLPAQAAVKVEFPKEQRSRIVPQSFSIRIDATRLFSADPEIWSQPTAPSTEPYNLSNSDVGIVDLPTEVVNVIEVDPNSVELKASLRTLKLAVEVVTSGQLPAQYEQIDKLIPQPLEIEVTGSESRLAELGEPGRKIQTVPIDLSGVTQSDQLPAELAVPDGVTLLNRRQSRVTVNIAVRERSVRQTVENVPFALLTMTPGLEIRILPPTAGITVEGPPSALKQLTVESFTFTPQRPPVEQPGRAQSIAVEAGFSRARVPQESARLMKIVEVKPQLITVEFVARDGQADVPGDAGNSGNGE
jgi:YbbR domain-containing protein